MLIADNFQHQRISGLYPILDLEKLTARATDPGTFAERILRVRPALLQIRAKTTPARTTLATLRALAPLCRAAGTLLFANDRPDLALLAGAEGVHVGQEDLPIDAVRRLGPALKVGVSTHDLGQLAAALATRPDYVAFGPVFPTRSKTNHDPVVGLSLLEQACELARNAGIPLVAIGGIDLETAPSIGKLGAAGAVIGALDLADLDAVESAARALHAALGGA